MSKTQATRKAKPKEHPLDGAFARVKRATFHLKEAQSISDRFLRGSQRESLRDMSPNIVHGDWQFDSGYRGRRVQLPIDFRLSVGEAIHNLRCALDYLVFELARHDTPSVPNAKTQFPICDSPQHFKQKLGHWLKGVSSSHIDSLESLQPYAGRNHLRWLKTLRDTSNRDKHRTLVATTDIASATVRMGRGLVPLRKRRGSVRRQILARGATGKRDVHIDAQTTLKITFQDRRDVFITLNNLVRRVPEVLKLFKPEFKV